MSRKIYEEGKKDRLRFEKCFGKYYRHTGLIFFALNSKTLRLNDSKYENKKLRIKFMLIDHTKKMEWRVLICFFDAAILKII